MRRRLAAALLCVLAWPAGAQHSCSFSNVGGTLVDFGLYNALQGDHDATGTIEFTCLPDLLIGLTVPYTVSISPGTGSGGSFSPRQLVFGGDALNYNLYSDLLRTVVWGDGTLGTGTVSGQCVGACSVLVFGRIFGGQTGAAGAYSDSVVVTIDF